MRSQRRVRLAGAAGLAFVALLLVAAFLPADPPPFDPRPEDVRAFWADQRQGVLAAALLTALAGPAWLVFATALAAPAARMAAAAYLALSLVAALVAATPVASAEAVPGVGDDLAVLLWHAHFLALALSAVPLAVTAVAAGVAGEWRVLSVVLGGVGGTAAAVGVMAPGSGAGVWALLVLAVWAAVVAGRLAFGAFDPGTAPLPESSHGEEM